MNKLPQPRKNQKIKQERENGLPNSSQSLRFITKAEVLYKIGRSNSTLYKMIAAGQFPKPFHPHNSRSSFWLEKSVDGWMLEILEEAGRGDVA